MNYNAYIPFERRLALVNQITIPEKLTGAVLFADISGFTPLTQALMKELGRHRGAEELTRYLNEVYTALIEPLHEMQGSVLTFSGDAITCWLDQDNGYRAVDCAIKMQEVMKQFESLHTPLGTPISLGVKIAAVVGKVKRFVIGDPTIQLYDVIAGNSLVEMATAEHQAERGDIVVGEQIVTNLGALLQVKEWRVDAETKQRFAVVAQLFGSPELVRWPEEQELSAEIAKQWLLTPIYNRLQTDTASFLAELRPAVILFLRFGGIDYDNDPEAGIKLSNYIAWCQQNINKQEGVLLQLTIGDKGSYIYASFGTPIAHQDDSERAIEAALDLQKTAEKFPYIGDVQIGLSQGQVWSGAYGSPHRQTYGVMGNEVNISARLMGNATPGQILVHHKLTEMAATQYRFNQLGEIEVKGVTGKLKVAEVVGRQAASIQQIFAFFKNKLVGRDELLRSLTPKLMKASAREGQLHLLTGQIGAGKSHVTAVFTQQSASQGFRVAAGFCQSTRQETFYYPWRHILRSLLELDYLSSYQTTSAEYIEQLKIVVQTMNPEWIVRFPLFGDLFGLPIPDNQVTATFSPELRQDSLIALVIELVQLVAEQSPLLLIFEDVHWMDESSRRLTEAVSWAIQDRQVMLYFTTRPVAGDQASNLQPLQEHPGYSEQQLPDLLAEDSGSLIDELLFTKSSMIVRELLYALAHGNPLFTSELTRTLRDTHVLVQREDQVWTISEETERALQQAGCLVMHDGEWRLIANAPIAEANLDMPDSLQQTVLARIDRSLPDAEKLLLKVASTIGRTFAYQLVDAIHPQRATEAELRQQLLHLEGDDFLFAQSNTAYLFRHNSTYQAVYDTLLFSQRRALHAAIAEWYEDSFGHPGLGDEENSALAPYYTLLALHWRRAENIEKEQQYTFLAGKQAAHQYANDEALRYLSRSLALSEESDIGTRYRLYLLREAVYDRMGSREAQEKDLEQLTFYTPQLSATEQATIYLRWANFAAGISEHQKAADHIEKAVLAAQAAGNIRLEMQALIAGGRSAWQQSDFETAVERLELALSMAQESSLQAEEADALLNLGAVYFYQQNGKQALAYYETALPLFRELGDRKQEAGCLSNLAGIYGASGDYLLSQQYAEQALAICQEIGFRRGQVITRMNLLTDHLDIGNFIAALNYLDENLSLSRELNFLMAEAICLDNIGIVYYQTDEYEKAIESFKKAIALQQLIGDRSSEGFTRQHLAKAFHGTGSFDAALESYEQALQIREELEQEPLRFDTLAGLALLAFEEDSIGKAEKYVAEIVAWIDEHGSSGFEYGPDVQWICYQLLQHSNVTQTKKILAQAKAELLERAAGIQDERLRENFLQNIRSHRSIISESI